MFLGSIIKPTNQPQENKPMTATHAGGMMELSSDFFVPWECLQMLSSGSPGMRACTFVVTFGNKHPVIPSLLSYCTHWKKIGWIRHFNQSSWIKDLVVMETWNLPLFSLVTHTYRSNKFLCWKLCKLKKPFVHQKPSTLESKEINVENPKKKNSCTSETLNCWIQRNKWVVLSTITCKWAAGPGFSRSQVSQPRRQGWGSTCKLMSQTHSPAKLCSWQFQLEFPCGSVSPFVHPKAFSHIGCHQSSWRISLSTHKKKKTDEKQSTNSKVKGHIKYAQYKGNLLVKSAIVRVPATSSKREKKWKMKKATIGYTSSTAVFLLAILWWLPPIGSNMCNRGLGYG